MKEEAVHEEAVRRLLSASVKNEADAAEVAYYRGGSAKEELLFLRIMPMCLDELCKQTTS